MGPGPENEKMERRYRRGDASPDELRAAIDEILGDLSDPSDDDRAALEAAGAGPGDLSEAEVTVREEGHGVEPVSILIGLGIAAGSKVASDVWDDIVWPRIKRKLGEGALGDEEE